MRDLRLGRTAALAAALTLLTNHTATAQATRRADEDFAVAMGLLRRDLHEEAAAQLRRLLQRDPDFPRAAEALYRLGTCYEAMGEPPRAIDALEQSLGAARADFTLRPECRYRLGNLLRAEGRGPAARRQYQALVAEVGADHYLRRAASYAAGECARDDGDDEGALDDFLAAAEEGGEDDGRYAVPALYQAGSALFRLERFADAAATFGRAADRQPRGNLVAECRYMQGQSAANAGDHATAERAYSAAVEAGGEWADDAQLGLALCAVQTGSPQDALRRFQQLLSAHSDSPLAPRATVEIGRLLHQAGNHEAARDVLGALLDELGDDHAIRAEALELRGLAQLDGGAAEPAARSFEAALAAGPDEDAIARLWHALGEARSEATQWQAAADAYERARQRAQGALRGDAWYGSVLALHKLGSVDQSIEAARALLREHPDHRLAQHARFAIGENLFAARDYAGADEAYAEVDAEHELAGKAAWKRAWCAFLAENAALAAQRFAALTGADDFGEEALSMTALATFNAGDDDRALQLADTYRARYPEGAHLARTERVAARVLTRRNELRAAAQRIANAARAEGDGGQAAEDELERASLLYKQGDYAAAADVYQQLARDETLRGRALEGMAWCAFEIGDDAACLEHIQAALAQPDGRGRAAELLELRIASLSRTESWDEVEQTAAEFLRQLPDHARAPEAAFAMGLAQSKAGRHGDAIATFGALADHGGLQDPAKLYYEWAWACRNNGDEPGALRAFAQVASHSEDPDTNGEARLHLGLAALAAEDAENARQHFAAVQGRYRGQALYRAGFTWLDADDAERAQPLFQELLDLGAEHPLHHEARFLVGECAFLRGDHESAAEQLGALLEAAPEHDRAQRARLRYGRSLLALSRANDAIAQLETMLQRGAAGVDEMEGYLFLGRARAAAGQHERAEQDLLRVTELSTGELAAEAQYRIGEVRQAQRDLNGAIDAFVKLSFVYAHEEWVRRGLLQAGLCYAELSQPSKAAKFLAELVERFPDSEEGRRARSELEDLKGQ